MAAGQLIREQPHSASRICIGEGVWIGRGAVILKGVTIGDGAVIVANSVVTRNVRPMAIVGGTPAKEIRLRGPAAASPEDGARAEPHKTGSPSAERGLAVTIGSSRE